MSQWLDMGCVEIGRDLCQSFVWSTRSMHACDCYRCAMRTRVSRGLGTCAIAVSLSREQRNLASPFRQVKARVLRLLKELIDATSLKLRKI